MPKEQKPERDRTPEETAALAMDVMKRMLSAPPTPHVESKNKQPKKKLARRS